jgi:hypothetical protein
MDETLETALKKALLDERRRGVEEGMNRAIGAINTSYNGALDQDADEMDALRDFTTWECRDRCIEQISDAQDKLKKSWIVEHTVGK